MENLNLSCPLPVIDHDQIILGHGSGGLLSYNLIKSKILPRFNNNYLDELSDQAVVNINGSRIAFTTDSFVVNPIFFPGGNIGDLAVNGTINDLAVGGAEPLYLSCGLIIEEGFPMSDLDKILTSMQKAAKYAGVTFVTGDTKVVNKGHCDKIFINTSGLGVIDRKIELSPKKVVPGDKIIISAPIGLHGITILAERGEFEFESNLKSDTTPLNELTNSILRVSNKIKWMRDPTRGGVASTLNELAKIANVGIKIREAQVPIPKSVKAACELLGFDPLYVANEGVLIAIVAEEDAGLIIETIRKFSTGQCACEIGKTTCEHPGLVLMETDFGTERIVDMLIGEQLPRIC